MATVARHIAILVRTLLLFSCVLLLSSCDTQDRKRPFGDLKIGLVQDLLAPVTYLPKMRLMVRHDAGGFSVMSTACTHDLTPLVLKPGPEGGRIFTSNYSESQYREDGTVIHGPAVANLPYYKAMIDQGQVGGPKDTLYVVIGDEVAPSWRLPG